MPDSWGACAQVACAQVACAVLLFAPVSLAQEPPGKLERTNPTTLRAGMLAVSSHLMVAREGAFDGSSVARTSWSTDALFPSLSWGITDRLHLNFTRPGLAYRFGERGGVEWIPSFSTGLTLRWSRVEGDQVAFFPVLRFDSRVWLGAQTALAWGVSAGSLWSSTGEGDCSVLPEACGSRTRAFDEWRVGARVGVVTSFGDVLTLAPAVGVGLHVDTRAGAESPLTELQLLGSVSRGVWSDPLVRFHLARWVAVDGFMGLSFVPDTTEYAAFAGVGFTIVW